MSQKSKVKSQTLLDITHASSFDIQLSTFDRLRAFTLSRTGESKGFTLIEMLVVVGIISLVSVAVLVNSGKLGGAFILQSFAYDMALSIRQAQTYGISVQSFGGQFSYAYGMHFESADDTHYYLFADVNNNGVFDAGASPTELVQNGVYTITRGFKITSLHATPAVGPEVPVTQLDIIFKRPEPDAWISVNDPPLACIRATGVNCQTTSRITVTAPRGDIRNVVVPANGQISVQ